MASRLQENIAKRSGNKTNALNKGKNQRLEVKKSVTSNKNKTNTKSNTKTDSKVTDEKKTTKLQQNIEKRSGNKTTPTKTRYTSKKEETKVNKKPETPKKTDSYENVNKILESNRNRKPQTNALETGRQGTQRSKVDLSEMQKSFNDTFGKVGESVGKIVNKTPEVLENVGLDLASSALKGYDILKESFMNGTADFALRFADKNPVTQGLKLVDNVAELINPEYRNFKAIDEDNLSNKLSQQVEKNRQKIYEDTTEVEKGVLHTVESVSNWASHLLLGMATGGAVNPLTTMSLQAGSNKTYQNLQEGYDYHTSLGNGVLTGTMTALTEKLPLDNVQKIVSSGLGQFSLAALATQSLSEGLEEGTEYLVEPLIDKLTLGKQVEYSAGELFMSVALGMSSGALIGAGANVVPIINSRKTKNQLQADMDVLVEYKNTNVLSAEEENIINQTINIAQKAIKNFDSKSVIGNAVQFESDKVNHLSVQEIKDNFNKFVQPQIAQENRINANQQSLNNILDNAQKVLSQKGINMDAVQYTSLNEDVRKQVDKVQGWANDLGVKLAFSTSVGKDGMYDKATGTTIVNPDSELAPLTAFTHEITHGVEASRFYPILDSLIVGNKDITNQLEKIKTRYAEAGVELDDDGARREYIAIQTQELLGNEDFVKRLVRYNNSVAYRIYEGIKHIVSKTDTLQDIEYNFLKAFREYGIDVGQPQTKYSFGGSNAWFSDNTAYKKALEMKSNGVDNETIWRETGWHQGYDGKWRFEIDDSQMKIHKQGDVKFKKENPDYVRYHELFDKYIDDEITPEEIEEYEKLFKLYGKDYSRLINRLESGEAKLEDILEHDALFAKYPQLADINFRLEQLGFGQRGYFDPYKSEIVLDKRLFMEDRADKDLIHEIQHAIQRIENFARGGNPSFYESQKTELTDWIKGVRQNLDLYLKDIKYDEFSEKILEEIESDKRPISDLWKAQEEYKANSKYAKQISAIEEQLEELQKEYEDKFGKISETRSPYELYLNTAGEIEARDTEARLRMTKEERKGIAPKSRLENVKNDKVVFAEDYRYSIGLSSSDLEQRKKSQLEIINKTNPAPSDYLTWIRNVEDIKTLEETLDDPDWKDYDEFNPDLTRDMINKAIETGKIVVYSSHPIKNGIFVSPSYMEAESYSGNGKVYSKKVKIEDVAWIDPTQGQIAKVDDVKYSIGLTPEDLKNPTIKKELNKYQTARNSFEKQIKELVNVKRGDQEYNALLASAVLEQTRDGKVSEETLNQLKEESWQRLTTYEPNEIYPLYQEVKKYMKGAKINISSLGIEDGKSGDFASKKDWDYYRKKHFGKLNFSKNAGQPIDVIYQELCNLYPGVFDENITSTHDQLMAITEFIDLPQPEKNEVHLSEHGVTFEDMSNDIEATINNLAENINAEIKLREFQQQQNDRKKQEKMILSAGKWIPNYEIIRKKYPEFTEYNFNKALLEQMTTGKVTEDTTKLLRDDILSSLYFNDTNEMDNVSRAVKDFLDDSIQYITTHSQYESNKAYMGSVASRVNELLTSYNASDGDTIQDTYNKVEKHKQAKDILNKERQKRRVDNTEAVESLLFKGKDAKSYFLPLEGVLDLVANGDVELRSQLRDTLEFKKYEAQTEYVSRLNQYNDVINQIVKSGIIEGSKESKATQWLMEKHKEDGSEYTNKDLYAEFDYTMKNGKKAYENIEEAAKLLRTTYDEIFKEINRVRESIYGDIDLNDEINTQELKAQVDMAKHKMNSIRDQLKNNPTDVLQATYDEAIKEYRRLTKRYSAHIERAKEGDTTRRQQLQYRKDYAHHKTGKTGFIKSLLQSVEGRKEVPTYLAGISDDSQPKSGFSKFFMKQTGGSYEADAVGGFAEYLQDASRIIAYDPYIDYVRDFTDDIRATAEDDNMSKFTRYLTDYANDMAGKTNKADRWIRDWMGDEAFGVLKKINSRVKANAILGNARTAVTQVFNAPNGIGILTEKGGAGAVSDITKGITTYMTSLLSGAEDFSSASPFMQSRYFDTDTGKKGIGATAENIANFMLTKGDEITSKMIWNSAYQQALRTNQEDPIFYADDITRRAVAGRGVGEVPLALQSQIVNLVIPFQVETNNAFRTLTGMTRNKHFGSMITILLANWIFNNIGEIVTGSRIAYDPIDAIGDALKDDEDDEENKILKALWRFAGETLGSMPGGAYIPTLFGMSESDTESLFGESDPSRYGTGNLGLSVFGNAISDISKGNYLDAASDITANLALPGGGKQAQRTIEALQVNGMLPQFENGKLVKEPAYYANNGKIAFVNNQDAILDSPGNVFDFTKQVLFGKWAGKEAQKYIDSGFKVPSDRQNNIFDALNQSMTTYDSFKKAEEVYETKKEMTGDDSKLQFINYLNDGEFTGEQKNDIYDIYYGDNKTTTKLNEIAPSIGLTAEQTYEVKTTADTTKSLEDSKDEFIKYLHTSDFTGEQKNGIYDVYFGDSDVTERINKFSTSAKLNGEQAFNVKALLATTQSLKDSKGETIRNSKALSIRKQLDELGLYDDVIKYINSYNSKIKNEDDKLTYGDFGLNKTVVEMSNSEFGYEYKSIYGKSYQSKTDSELLSDAYNSTFSNKSSSSKSNKSSKKTTSGKTSNKTTSTTEDEGLSFEQQKAMIDSIIAKAYSNTSSSKDAYDKVNDIISKISKTNRSSNTSINSDLIKKYLKDHPYDAHLFN